MDAEKLKAACDKIRAAYEEYQADLNSFYPEKVMDEVAKLAFEMRDAEIAKKTSAFNTPVVS